MRKRLNLFITITLVSICARAQWTSTDSLGLGRILNTEGEIRLNMDAVRQIDFGTFGDPLIINESPGLNYDESLPRSDYFQREAPNQRFSLMIYTPTTKFNYDPVLRRKIKVGTNTWQTQPYKYLFNISIPTNWAQNWRDNTLRTSVDQIQAAGVRQVILGDRAVSRYVPTYSIVPINGNGINLGGGKTMVTTGAGGSIGGLNLMKPFTKDFWDRRAVKRRARTLEVLKTY